MSSGPRARRGAIAPTQPSSTSLGGCNSEIIRGRCAEGQMPPSNYCVQAGLVVARGSGACPASVCRLGSPMPRQRGPSGPVVKRFGPRSGPAARRSVRPRAWGQSDRSPEVGGGRFLQGHRLETFDPVLVAAVGAALTRADRPPQWFGRVEQPGRSNTARPGLRTIRKCAMSPLFSPSRNSDFLG